MNDKPLYAYLRSHVDLGHRTFIVRARPKGFSDGVEFDIGPCVTDILPDGIGATYEVSSDPEMEDFDFIFNVAAVPEPDPKKFELMMRRLNLREGLDEHGKEIQMPMD